MASWIGLVALTNKLYGTPPDLFLTTPALTEIWHRTWPFFVVILLILVFRIAVDRKIRVIIFTDRADRDTLVGLVFGIVWIGGTFGLLLMTNCIVVVGPYIEEDAIFWVIAVILAAFTHELLFRGYLFSALQERFSGFTAVICMAILPICLSPGAITGNTVVLLSIFAQGIMLGMMRIYTGGMLAPLLAYLVWAEVGTVIFGTVPIGIHAPAMWTTAITGIELVTGGDQMFAGSILGLFVTVILIDLNGILMGDKNEIQKKSVFRFRRKNEAGAA